MHTDSLGALNMATPLSPVDRPEAPDPDGEPLINDPGNEDPGSFEEDALVPLIPNDDDA
jgi:hypothetical protein